MGVVLVNTGSAAPTPVIDLFLNPGQGAANGQFNLPRGVAADASATVFYVADHNNDRIQKFDEDGSHLLSWGTTGTANGQFDDPGEVTVDDDGNVYVADAANNRIQKFDDVGGFLLTWGSLGSGNGEFQVP
jgi:DNA-binding beta-propeller fold protein YncE